MTDLIIIGAGPGGYKAAVYAAKHGLKVTIFEDVNVGGTCLNVGCIPTKTYVHSATFAEATERQQQVVEQLRNGVETLLSHPNITLVREKGVFIDAHTVSGYTAPNIIVATGSSPKMLPIAGADSPRVVDSTGLLSLKALPKKLCIIGAGVIGMEFASVFQRFGSEVTVIEYLKECLPMVDSDIAKRLRKLLEKRGITFRMKTAVQDLSEIDADVILMATGRKPNVSPDFANAGFDYDERRGITTDKNFETTVKGIYAIGDVNGKQMLAHAAEMQGIHVVNLILVARGKGQGARVEGQEARDEGQEARVDGIRFDVMPAAIFTEPEAACVGPTEDQLKEQGVPFECHKSFYRANGKALAMNETEGMVKLCCEPGEGRLLSAHVFGAHAADIVQEVTAYITLGATLRQLRDTVHIHPTLSEVLIEVH